MQDSEAGQNHAKCVAFEMVFIGLAAVTAYN